MAAAEMTLAKKWFVEDGESPMDIARRLGCITCTLTRLLIQRMARKRHGAEYHLVLGRRQMGTCLAISADELWLLPFGNISGTGRSGDA